jgi:hypothetical protein
VRWFFLILLLLNASMFFWYSQNRTVKTASPQAIDAAGLRESLKLLSEVPPEQLLPLRREQKIDAVIESEIGVKLEEIPRVCFHLGPLDNRPLAEQAVDALGLDSGSVVIAENKRPLSSLYRIYVKDPSNEIERKRLKREFTSSGLESYRMAEGALKGDFSLGLYRNKESAIALTQALQDHNYDAHTYEEKRYHVSYHVEIEIETGAVLAGRLAEMLGPEYPVLKKQKNGCRLLHPR